MPLCSSGGLFEEPATALAIAGHFRFLRTDAVAIRLDSASRLTELPDEPAMTV